MMYCPCGIVINFHAQVEYISVKLKLNGAKTPTKPPLFKPLGHIDPI